MGIVIFGIFMIIAVICYYIVQLKTVIIGITCGIFLITIAVKAIKKQVQEIIDRLIVSTFIVGIYAILVDLWALMISAALGIIVIAMKAITNKRYRAMKIVIDILSWSAVLSLVFSVVRSYTSSWDSDRTYFIIPIALISIIILITKISKHIESKKCLSEITRLSQEYKNSVKIHEIAENFAKEFIQEIKCYRYNIVNADKKTISVHKHLHSSWTKLNDHSVKCDYLVGISFEQLHLQDPANDLQIIAITNAVAEKAEEILRNSATEELFGTEYSLLIDRNNTPTKGISNDYSYCITFRYDTPNKHYKAPKTLNDFLQ